MADPEPFSALFSYWYYKSDGAFGKVTDALKRAAQRGQPVRVLVDSGAFSADTQGHRITTDEYAGWLRDTVVPEWGPWLVGCLNLDVLRDPVASWTNWSRLRTLGHDTIPVTHMGDGIEVLDRYVDAGADYVALGAMVGKSITRKVRWAAHVHKHVLTVHPDARLHGLGLAAQSLVERLPWFSVDSTAISGTVTRWGTLPLYDPDVGKLVLVRLPDGSALKHAGVLRKHYGADPAAITFSDASNRNLVLDLVTQSVFLWAKAMRKTKGHRSPSVHFVWSPKDLDVSLRKWTLLSLEEL